MDAQWLPYLVLALGPAWLCVKIVLAVLSWRPARRFPQRAMLRAAGMPAPR
jgi:hypothetical protein